MGTANPRKRWKNPERRDIQVGKEARGIKFDWRIRIGQKQEELNPTEEELNKNRTEARGIKSDRSGSVSDGTELNFYYDDEMEGGKETEDENRSEILEKWFLNGETILEDDNYTTQIESILGKRTDVTDAYVWENAQDSDAM